MPKHHIKTKKNELDQEKKSSDPFVIQEGRLKEGKIDSVYRYGWAEEVYMNDVREKEVIGKSFNFSKIPLIGMILLFFLFVLFGKVAWLQILKGDYYYTMAEGNRIRIERIEAKRGVIYDRNLKPLVRNKANFLLYLVPADLPEEESLEKIISRISETLGDVTKDDIKAELARVDKYSLEAYLPLFITDDIEYERAMKLYLESSSWPGVILSNKTRREYLHVGDSETEEEAVKTSLTLSHILGYTSKINSQELEEYGDEYLPIDYIGKMGIEYFWENELKGRGGKKQIEVDALGKEKKIIGQEDVEDGHNLILSLDVEQQIKLEKILIKHLEGLNLNRGVAIVTDPRNGEILAMVNIPSYNNNKFAAGISQEEYSGLIDHPDTPLFNRAVSGEYPSGSTIKPVLAAAALEEGIISENTTFLSLGGIRIGQWFFPDWRAGGHGRTNVKKAIAESVNTFFYYIGGGHEDFKGLGVDRIVEYGELFGLNSQTGIDLAGEASGFLPTREWKEEVKGERWYIGDTYHLAIGQGDLLVTPLQVAVFTSVFANGGKLYRPHFIKEVLSSDDELIKKIDEEPIREDFISSYNIHVIRQGLRQAVTSGSARRLQTVPVAVAGKTGTAQWSTKENTHAWFTGFAPYDAPEMVITVLVEKGGEGSDVAVPIAEEYLQWYFGEYKK